MTCDWWATLVCMNDITYNYYKVYNIPPAASAAGALASLRSIPTSGVRETPSGMSTYRVLLSSWLNRQHSIGGHAAGVLMGRCYVMSRWYVLGR